MKLKHIILTILLIGIVNMVNASIQPACWFSDNMVLQRDIKVPVWGWADPSETITILFNSQKVSIKSGEDGFWKVHLSPMKAGGPYNLDISGSSSSTVKLENILIGDIWICAGQSNMWRPFINVNSRKPEAEWEFVKSADVALLPVQGKPILGIRLFHIGNNSSSSPVLDIPRANTWGPFERTNLNKDICPKSWRICSRENLRYFSRLGYIFGKALHEDLKIPIGLICIAQGSTSINQWCSGEVIEKVLGKPQNILKTQRYKKASGHFDRKYNGTYSDFFNGMIYPLIGFGIKGFIWWQGENDARGESRFGSTQSYVKGAFKEMIKDYRSRWGQGNFPFIFVQQQNHFARDKGMAIRDYQMQTLELPNTGMAVIFDNTQGIHPPNKADVGKRLLPIAKALVYGQDIPYSGPIYSDAIIEGNKIRIKFLHTGSGLLKGTGKWVRKGGKLSNADDSSAPFEIMGNNGNWVKANAIIDGNDVLVSAPGISIPKHAAYGIHHVNPKITNIRTTLANQEGFPASPFDTATWKGLKETTSGKK